MAVRANPRLIEELELYGAQDVAKCYQCGNCSAACPFSREPFVFPRRSMRYLQMGLEERLRGTLEPWLCYYCGECSEECPREAEPGETMMSLRRWLTAQYDFTGISAAFYRSWRIELTAILVLALITGLGFTLYGLSVGRLDVYDGPGAFLPSSSVHVFDWIMAIVLASLLAVNCARMWWFSIGRDPRLRVPLSVYLRKAWLVPVHFATQKRWRECERRAPWVRHLSLVAGYVAMLVLIMLFLEQVQSGPAVDWRVHAPGYVAAALLLGTAAMALVGRLRRSEPLYRHSHETDWIFLILLLVVTATGVVQHVLHRAGLPTAANVTYVIHLMGVVPMLTLEVPFSKWAHLAYRPLAMYLSEVQAEALAARAVAPATLPKPRAA